MKDTRGNRCLAFLKGLRLETDPNLPGAKQKTPFNISRLSLLIITVIYTATSACIYFDWSAIRNLLLSVGKYKNLNVGEYTDITLTPQYKRINNLYPTTLAIHFTMSVFCGFLYDHIGPKFTAMIGQMCNIISWILLSIDSTTVDTTLMSFVFLGLGADTAFIPVLTISNLYPDASTFILTVVGAAASLSYAVPATLNLIYRKYPSTPFAYICYGYILVILVPCLLPFKGLDYYIEKDPSRKSCTEGDGQDGRRDRKTVTSQTNDEVDVEMQPFDTEHLGASKGRNGNESNTPSTRGNTPNSGKHSRGKNTSGSNRKSVSSKGGGSTIQGVQKDQEKSSSKGLIEEGSDFHKKSISLFFKILLTYPAICIIVYFILFNISTVFYGMVTDTYFSYDRSIINIINILMPISCVPCIIFGRFINKYGSAIIIILMNAFSALMHLTALIKHRVAGLVSAFLYMCVTSIYTSQIYCFIQNSFPSVVFGKLLGFASLCGGLFSLLCENLYDQIVSKDGKSVDPTNVVLLLVITFIIMFLPLTVLYFRKYERSIENLHQEGASSQSSARA
ncbi:transporter [Plasmodium cynomolgi strain B]|uniref:Transporter n=1 Tax=Plasmodium cynomolgi (strain B) TaxID=1120755 RepID=K6UCC7_PLACD|nr:transporter [Plasmodium cynomolgi strain B]GAB64621.1 transporter [Plasmodium cynomolgi strain B]